MNMDTGSTRFVDNRPLGLDISVHRFYLHFICYIV